MCAVEGFSVGDYSFSCTKDCPATTCMINQQYDQGKSMIVGTLPDVFDTLVCGSKITLMYGRTPCSQIQSHRRTCQQLDRTADPWLSGSNSCLQVLLLLE